jgi:predicted nucleic acid-binding protein
VSEPLVVDANPLIAALMGGRAEDILLSQRFSFHSAQHTMFEVQKYVPRVAAKLRVTDGELLPAYNLLPVVVYQPAAYGSHIEQARALIEARDRKDVQILALTLKLGYPLWSDDRDFEGIEEIQLIKTKDLISRLSI